MLAVREKGEDRLFQDCPEFENQIEKGEKDGSHDDVSPEGVHHGPVEMGAPGVPGMLGMNKSSAFLKQTHGEGVPLRRDHRVGRLAMGLLEGLLQLLHPYADAVFILVEPDREIGIALQQLDGQQAGRYAGHGGALLQLIGQGLHGLFDMAAHQWGARPDGGLQCSKNRHEKLVNVNPLSGIGGDHRHTQECTQARFIDVDALSLRLIDHIQADHHRFSQFDDLQGQLKTAAEERGIDDIDDQGNGLFEQIAFGLPRGIIEGGEGVDARQIDEIAGLAVDADVAVGEFDGCAGKIGGNRAISRHLVENGAFTAVGLAEQDNTRMFILRMGGRVGVQRKVRISFVGFH